MSLYRQIHPDDNVAVALSALPAGSLAGDICLKDDIPAGHKFALRGIPAGGQVIKYGAPIGHAVTDIETGAHVHTHNIASNLSGLLDYEYRPEDASACPVPAAETRAFMGYTRPGGRVGIRNELWIIPTVGCVNAYIQNLGLKARAQFPEQASRIIWFTHPYGCSQMGDDQDNTRAILRALLSHPNAGAVLLVGLGCENSPVGSILEGCPACVDPDRIRTLVLQDTEDELSDGLSHISELLGLMDRDIRTPHPLSELIIGLKCGGSDGFSGITANPLIGAFSDRLIAAGGSAVLTEVPEMFGAEHLLMARAVSRDVFDRTVSMINRFKQYFMDHGQDIESNPSPGNKAGGISTLEDKALGCTQKAGSAPVCDVLDYGESVRTRGLSLLYAPGNDLVSSTALAAAGCHIVLFSTGRGTPFGSPVPTVKIASNTGLAIRKKNWIDFDAGALIGGTSPDTVLDAFTDLVLGVASGSIMTASERNDAHDMAIFKQGVTL